MHLSRRRFEAMLGRIALLPLRMGRELLVKSAATSGRQQIGGRKGAAKMGRNL
jgi:hypothetical protein